MEKIVFIEPRPPDLHVFARSPIPRLGTVLMGTILKKHGYNVKSYIEVISELSELDVRDILSADCVGISCITSTAPRSYEIASNLKKLGIPVFMGGPHVTYMTEEAMEHCDFVFRGEADETIVDFIKALEKGEGVENIPGVSYKKDGKIVSNRSVSFPKDLDILPAADFSIIKGLEENPYKKLAITPIMTSRGCPYDCSFCSVTQMFGHQYRMRSTEKVLEEVENAMRGGAKWLFFYDDNFTANRKRTKELLHTMIERKLKPNWTAQVRVDVAKDHELMDLITKSGCHTVYIGFESINPETLKIYNKKQSVEDIEKCIRLLHKNGIRIHGMFVFGSDEDTTSTIQETVRFAKKNDLDSVRFLILTPLPGTRLHRELEKEGRIVSRDWSLYDAHHVVFEPRKMSYYELQSATMMAPKDFYSILQIVKRAARRDWFNVMIKAYGRNLTKTWIKKNDYFVEHTKSLTGAGRKIELAARKTADDIKEKFRQLESCGLVTRTRTHGSL